jgi:hypothetical protein
VLSRGYPVVQQMSQHLGSTLTITSLILRGRRGHDWQVTHLSQQEHSLPCSQKRLLTDKICNWLQLTQIGPQRAFSCSQHTSHKTEFGTTNAMARMDMHASTSPLSFRPVMDSSLEGAGASTCAWVSASGRQLT